MRLGPQDNPQIPQPAGRLAIASPVEQWLVVLSVVVPMALGFAGQELAACLLSGLCLLSLACLLAVWKATSFLLAFLRDIRPALRIIEKMVTR